MLVSVFVVLGWAFPCWRNNFDLRQSVIDKYLINLDFLGTKRETKVGIVLYRNVT